MSSKPAQLACYMIFTLGDHSVNAILEFDDKEQFYSIHILNEFQAAKLFDTIYLFLSSCWIKGWKISTIMSHFFTFLNSEMGWRAYSHVLCCQAPKKWSKYPLRYFGGIHRVLVLVYIHWRIAPTRLAWGSILAGASQTVLINSQNICKALIALFFPHAS